MWYNYRKFGQSGGTPTVRLAAYNLVKTLIEILEEIITRIYIIRTSGILRHVFMSGYSKDKMLCTQVDL